MPQPGAASKLPAMTHDSPRALAGIGFTLLGGLVFSASNATAKYLSAGYPPGQTLFVRSVIALLILSPLLRWADIRALFAPGQRGLQALRCGCSAIEVGMYYWALTWLGLAEISAIYLAGPIYVTAMSALFLGERVGWRRWAAVAVGFTGVLVALQPGSGAVSVPALIAVAGSVLYSISLVATRRLRGTPNALLVASQVAALAVPSAIPLGWAMPLGWDWLALAAVGVIAMCGYVCVNRGLQLAPASVVAPFSYASIVWASLLGYFVFGDVPSVHTLLGAALIVGAGLFIVQRQRRVAASSEGST